MIFGATSALVSRQLLQTSRGTRVCYRYAQIREEDGKSDLSGCSFVLSTKDGLAADLKLSHDYTRHRHQSPGDASSVYKSKSHRILLTLFSSQASGVQFIIVYQGIHYHSRTLHQCLFVEDSRKREDFYLSNWIN